MFSTKEVGFRRSPAPKVASHGHAGSIHGSGQAHPELGAHIFIRTRNFTCAAGTKACGNGRMLLSIRTFRIFFSTLRILHLFLQYI